MGQLTHHRTGLIAEAVRDLTLGGFSRADGAPEVLAAMLDLRGSVHLEERLAQRGARAVTAPPGDLLAPPSLLTRDYARARLDGIEASLARRMARPFEGRIRVPDAAAAHSMLEGAIASRTAGEIKAASRDVARAFRELLLAWIERATGDVAALRDEIADDLRARGPKAARLEALDATLRAATSTGVERLMERLAAASERAFAASVARAIRALPERASRDDLAPWFDRRGIVERELERLRAVVVGIFVHERAVLLALVTSAVDRGATALERGA